MAIEIKELHVRLFMGNGSDKEAAGTGETPVDPCSGREKQEQLVRDTAREVLRLLKMEERR